MESCFCKFCQVVGYFIGICRCFTKNFIIFPFNIQQHNDCIIFHHFIINNFACGCRTEHINFLFIKKINEGLSILCYRGKYNGKCWCKTICICCREFRFYFINVFSKNIFCCHNIYFRKFVLNFVSIFCCRNKCCYIFYDDGYYFRNKRTFKRMA